MKSLDGKVAIVTGGARDIGRAVSEKLASEGARVVVNYFSNPASGAETVSAIEAAGVPLWIGESYELGEDFLSELGCTPGGETEQIVRTVDKEPTEADLAAAQENPA